MDKKGLVTEIEEYMSRYGVSFDDAIKSLLDSLNDEIDRETLSRWCLNNAVTEKELEQAWNTAVAKKDKYITGLKEDGVRWDTVTPNIAEQLIDVYLI